MKKGISIWSFASPSLTEAFHTAKAAGFDGLEVALDLDGELTGLDAGSQQWQATGQRRKGGGQLAGTGRHGGHPLESGWPYHKGGSGIWP